jgi:hypothetical protein
MAVHEIVAVVMSPMRSPRHEIVTAVVTRQSASDTDTHWTLQTMLRAMNGGQQFVTRAPNGRQARVQRFTCAHCGAEHVRTHVYDGAIAGASLHEMPRAANPSGVSSTASEITIAPTRPAGASMAGCLCDQGRR